MSNRYLKRAYSVALLVLCICLEITAQTKITGNITDSKTKDALAGVSLMVKGKVIGTTTDVKGNFSLNTATPTPFKLVVTSIGYEAQEIDINSSSQQLNISMVEQAIMGQEVVVAASRVEEKVMKSPVAIEKMDIRAIQNTPSANFYDGLAAMKGVDMTTQGLLFKSINMRGFNSTGNPRVVQMIDGMDNQAPGLNFSLDNMVGMPELDVESVEVLPGAASALYGPNAINGIVLLNSKSPFLYQGLSASVRTGIMSGSNRPTVNTPLYDMSLRYAKAFNNKFAFKANASYITATDWSSTDYSNLNVSGNVDPNNRTGAVPDYDGVNVYGDEVQANMQTVGASMVSAGLIPALATGLIPNVNVSRTGYTENSLINPETKSLKLNGALHYRINEKVEAVAQINYGYGTTLYTGTGKYSLRNFNLTQAKFELRGDAFTARAYTTQERSGESFTAGLMAVQMLDAVKPHEKWFGEYVGAYITSKTRGADDASAHNAARKIADTGMPLPGSAAFETLLESKSSAYIKGRTGGGAFNDRSNLYHAEVVYNFKNIVKFADVLAGANYRMYQLRSAGTLFADLADGREGQINIGEYGGFLQAAKSMMNDHFRLTASLRYDKNQNFDGQFTPRVSGVFSFGDHNIRLSYQTGFRIPTTQNQYIDLLVPSARLIGGLPEFYTRYNLSNAYLREDVQALGVKIVASTKDPALQKSASDLITAQVTAAVTAAVNSAETQAKIKAGVTAAVTAAVRPTVESQVKAGLTAAVTAKVTSDITAIINQQVTLGLIANDPTVIAAAIKTTLDATLPGVLTTAYTTQLPTLVDAQMATPAVQTIISTQVTSALPGAIQKTLTDEIAKALPTALQANLPTVIQGLAVNANIGSLQPATIKPIVPERIASYEIGYKGLWGKKLFVDAYYYSSRYTNFLGGVVLLQPTASIAPGLLPVTSGVLSGNTRNAYSRTANSSKPINVNGYAIGANYMLGKGYTIGGNFSNNVLKDFVATNEVQYSGFNTPENRYNLTLGKRITADRKFGFAISYKHQDAYKYEASFVQPTTTGVALFTNTMVPKIDNVDAQISYKLSGMKSILKIGGTNLFGSPYIQAYGSPSIGSMYYVQINFDELMN